MCHGHDLKPGDWFVIKTPPEGGSGLSSTAQDQVQVLLTKPTAVKVEGLQGTFHTSHCKGALGPTSLTELHHTVPDHHRRVQ